MDNSAIELPTCDIDQHVAEEQHKLLAELQLVVLGGGAGEVVFA